VRARRWARARRRRRRSSRVCVGGAAPGGGAPAAGARVVWAVGAVMATHVRVDVEQAATRWEGAAEGWIRQEEVSTQSNLLEPHEGLG